MNIAYLANIRFPSERAHSSQIVQMCKAFIKTGATVDLFASRRAPSDKEALGKHVGFIPNFSITNIGPKRIYSRIKISFHFGEWWFALHFLIKGKASKYNYIFSRSEYVLWFLSFFVSSCKLVWESHDGRLNFFSKYIMWRRVYVVVTSQAQFKMFSQNTEKILLAPNSIDSSFFESLVSKQEARKRLGLKMEGRYTMYIGGFDKWKGPETFFECSQYDTSSTLVVIGGKEHEIEQYKKKYPDVIFLGSRPYHELVNNQQAADVLVVPNTAKNKLSREITSPLKLYAHMSSGVPIVMSDIPSLTSVVRPPYVTLCEPDLSKEMAKKITEVYKSYDEKSSSARELRENLKGYTWSKRADDIISFLN